MKELVKLENQLELANKRLTEVYKKPYYNMTDERRVHNSRGLWNYRIEILEEKIKNLKQ